MVTVKFLGPLFREDLKVEVTTFDELKEAILSLDDIDTSLLALSSLALNDDLIDCPENMTLKDGDIVCVLPPVCGG